MEKTKVIRIGADSYKTLVSLSTSSGKSLGALVDEWATAIQAAIAEDAQNASKIDVVTFRPKGKSLVIVTVLIPEFFGRLDLGDDKIDFTDFKNIVSLRKVKFTPLKVSGKFEKKNGTVIE